MLACRGLCSRSLTYAMSTISNIRHKSNLGQLGVSACICLCMYVYIYIPVALRPDSESWPSLWDFTITPRHATSGRIPLNEWTVRRRDLYLTTHNTSKHPCTGGIWIHTSSNRGAADQQLKPRGHWDKILHIYIYIYIYIYKHIQGPPKKCIHTLTKENSTLYVYLLQYNIYSYSSYMFRLLWVIFRP